jgi:hypothetical protein
MRGSLLARAIQALDLVDIESQSINIETVRGSLLFPLSCIGSACILSPSCDVRPLYRHHE